ncbi:MAG: hypothetical protein JNM36_14040 [Chitinophagales bacterium]|jgi:hypothetical protein|nr:hypothetical protein [Chitinophagales bacterium]
MTNTSFANPFFIVLCLLLHNIALLAQNTTTTPPPIRSVTLIGIDGAVQVPQADMAKRFGINANIGGGVFRKTNTNWLFGVDADFLFGNRIVEDSLVGNLATAQGYLLTQSGTYADIRFYERGIAAFFKFGKVFPISPKNNNSGIVGLLGIGAMQHHIKIIDKENSIRQLQGDYLKGYDRLSNGPAVSAYLGYLYLANNKLINFSAGVELSYARTKNRRSLNFDTQTSETNPRNDILLGARFSWFLPLYRKGSETKYYMN